MRVADMPRLLGLQALAAVGTLDHSERLAPPRTVYSIQAFAIIRPKNNHQHFILAYWMPPNPQSIACLAICKHPNVVAGRMGLGHTVRQDSRIALRQGAVACGDRAESDRSKRWAACRANLRARRPVSSSTMRADGTHVGCDTAQCGACTVHIDGHTAKACNVLAVQIDGSSL